MITSCTACGCTTIQEDHVTGDCICTECGLVVDTNFLSYTTQQNIQDTERLSTVSVEKIINEYGLVSSVAQTIEDWITSKHSTLSLKVICCAMHFVEMQTSYTYSDIRCLSKLMRIDYKDVCNEIEAITKYARCVTTESTKNEHDEWVHTLQSVLVDLSKYTICTSKDIAKMKKECSRLVHEKIECIFHRPEYIAYAILFEYGFDIIHKKDRLQIRMIHKKIFK